MNAQPPRTRQCHPGPQHGRRAARQFRAPGHADGHGGHRRSAVARLPEAQPGKPALGRPRSLRALERPRLDAALFRAAPDRLPARHRRTQEFPPARCAHCGPSGARDRDRHRDDDRAAGPGPRQRGRHGARGEEARRGLQQARARNRRPPHLGVPRRWLPDGRHFARGLRARRHLGPRQADLLLRRQRHLDRRRGRRLVHRRHAEALRGVRLAGDPRGGRARSGGRRARDPPREAREGQADADLLQDGDRLWRAEQAGQGGMPRRGARRRRSRARAQDARLAARALRRAGRNPRGLGRARRGQARGEPLAPQVQGL